jgi:putative GTP pyrophosphokinase
MAQELSKTQVDRLGDRLRKGDISEADLRLLDQYRRSFAEAYDTVVGSIRKELALEPTGRPAKSTTSISDKLRRESIRLTQIQDIAGCRLTVSDIANQDEVVQSLGHLFEHITVVDRRRQPSNGYRAVHVVANCHGKLIEIQVRTSLQHHWAELSEKISDMEGSEIKYGGGDEDTQNFLAMVSSLITAEESAEMLLKSPVWLPQNLAEAQQRLNQMREMLFGMLQAFNDLIGESEGENNALPD